MTDYNDGNWHRWNGGECPVHPKSVVGVMLRYPVDEDGDMIDIAGNWEWGHRGGGDITYFRVVTPYVEPAAEIEPLPYGRVRLSDGRVFDMTADRQPAFGMLTAEEKAALQSHGGPYQYWDFGWKDTTYTYWRSNAPYRVKPQPVRVTVKRNMWGDDEGNLWMTRVGNPKATKIVTVTHETVNGVPDYSTYRVKVT